jgi:hypothetical protein
MGVPREVPMRLATRFNRSRFGTWLNSPAGRLFRVSAGGVFLAVGLRHRHGRGGQASLAWSLLPLTAGAFDVCYISVSLGGPFRGSGCRAA